MPDQPESSQPSVTTTTNHDPESMFRPDATRKKLDDMVASFMLPAWVMSGADGSMRKCLSCDETLDNTAVRSIAMCLNAQHIGDIQVEVMCQACFASYLLHFRKACSKITDFCSTLLGDAPKTEPVPMSSIRPSDNNLADAIVDAVVADRMGTSACSTTCSTTCSSTYEPVEQKPTEDKQCR